MVLSWSRGKDSCKTLHEPRQGGAHEILALLTIVTPFTRLVPFRIGERVTRGSLCFCDLEPISL